LEDFHLPQKIFIPTRRDDPAWTKEFLSAFAQPEAEYFVDHDYPGWLVWGKEFPAYKVDPREDTPYDQIENDARKAIGKNLDRKWFNVFFGYLKQEPRDGSTDRFRAASSMLLQFAFNLMREGVASVTLEEIKKETTEVLGDGSDKHQHRATAEILGALVSSYRDSTLQNRNAMWEYVFPIVKKIFEDGLTPENSSYWTSFLHLVLVCYCVVPLFTLLTCTCSSKGRTPEDRGLLWNGSLLSDWICHPMLHSKKAPRYSYYSNALWRLGGISNARGLY
jgi:proteasome activator subunit 4